MIFMISAGHGGKDPGACANGYKESDIALGVRNLVAKNLSEMRHAVKTDGGNSENLALNEALEMMSGADLCVELHCNASTNASATGVEVISLPSKKSVAQRLARAVCTETGQRLRGEGGWIDQSKSLRKKLAFVEAGGLIIEMVFISNAGDMRRFMAAQERVALAIAAAMCGNQVGA